MVQIYVGKGMYHAKIGDMSSDGMLRFRPGGLKPCARTLSFLVSSRKHQNLIFRIYLTSLIFQNFFVVRGEIEFTCDEKTFQLSTFGTVSFKPGVVYEIKNKGAEDCILLFSRFDV